jgi:hypothetical protein
MTKVGNISNLAMGVGLVAVAGVVGYALFKGTKVVDSIKATVEPAIKKAQAATGYLAGTNADRTLGSDLYDTIQTVKESITKEGSSITPYYWDQTQAEKTLQALRQSQNSELPISGDASIYR